MKKSLAFSDAPGRERNGCPGGRPPIKDQSPDRKVRAASQGYLRLLGRCGLLCKNLLYALFFFIGEIQGMWDLQRRQQEGGRKQNGVGGASLPGVSGVSLALS